MIPCRRLHNLDTAKGDIISWIGLLVNLSVSQCISASVTTCVFEQAIFLCTGLGVQLKNVVYQELMRYRMTKCLNLEGSEYIQAHIKLSV